MWTGARELETGKVVISLSKPKENGGTQKYRDFFCFNVDLCNPIWTPTRTWFEQQTEGVHPAKKVEQLTTKELLSNCSGGSNYRL